MRIVLINQFFWPDAAPTSQLLTDVARFLAAQGHEVEVICGRSSYAAPDDDAGPPPPVVCHRVHCAPFASGIVGRLWSYISFFAGAFWTGIRIPAGDAIVTLTTPPMLSVMGAVLKKLRFEKHFIWEMDLFPEALADVGMLQGKSWIVRLLGWIADYARHESDGIIALGNCMRQRLIARGIPETKIHVAENWVNGKDIFPLPARRSGPLTVLYSGNLGRPHEVKTILYAMDQLKDDPRYHFRFVGGGKRRKEVQDFCQRNGISNVSFAPHCRREDLSRNLSEGDIGLVTQRQECLGTVVPSKVYGLMAAERPILYIGPSESTPAQIINRVNCGWQVDCGNGPAVVDLLKSLESHRDWIAEAGTRARKAFLDRYDLPQGVARVSGIITEPVYAEEACVA